MKTSKAAIEFAAATVLIDLYGKSSDWKQQRKKAIWQKIKDKSQVGAGIPEIG